MKLILSLILSVVLGFSATETTEPVKSNPFPSAELKTLDGEAVNTADFLKDGKITVVSFWATWCSPCKRELDAISDYYEEWQEDYDVQLIAITIDNQRSLAKVPATIETKGWEYIILSDANQDLMRKLNFQTIPQTFLLDREGNIVYTHNGYNSGDEFELEDHIIELADQ
jgi:peroxiredoxin